MNRLLLAAATAATFLAGGTLLAQESVRATVPFDFYVGSKAMPAGTYDLTRCSTTTPHILKVQHCTEGIAVLHLMHPSGTQPTETGVLVFHRYGEKYFLNEVQGLRGANMMLPVGPLEKSLQTENAQVRTFEEVTIPKPEQPQQPN